MGRFIKGEVVVLPFPFSDLSNAKRHGAGSIKTEKMDEVVEKIIEIISS